MDSFVKTLMWFMLILSLIAPIVMLIWQFFAKPTNIILSAVWAFGCSILASKLFIGDKKDE